jgi:DNA-binding NarL/FixJ family response regulator
MSLLILVVDDDRESNTLVCNPLEDFGYSVISAQDGRKAQKMIEKHQPHLIVTNTSMPEMDGYELIRWVRQHPIFRLLPVVFLTTQTNTEERIRAYQLGANVYLSKPIEFKELYAVIRNLLERSQQIWQLMQWELRLQIQEKNIEIEKQTVQMSSVNYSYSHNSKPKNLIVTNHQILFTPREKEVIKLLADGLSNSKIASCLFLSFRTIEKYVSNLLGKTGTNNRVELVRFAMEHNLID